MIDLNEVLREVNEIRHHELELEPISELPKGRRGSVYGCPIARALQRDYQYGSIFVLTTIIFPDANGRQVKLIPFAIKEFIDAFDRYNGFPELVG